jgi:hypothetical protein
MWDRPHGYPSVPQIWLTYNELAMLMNCDPIAARAVTVTLPLDRRRGRDGQTRAKLSPSLAEAFMESQAHLRLERAIDGCAGDLTAMHDRMAATSAPIRKAAAQ